MDPKDNSFDFTAAEKHFDTIYNIFYEEPSPTSLYSRIADEKAAREMACYENEEMQEQLIAIGKLFDNDPDQASIIEEQRETISQTFDKNYSILEKTLRETYFTENVDSELFNTYITKKLFQKFPLAFEKHIIKDETYLLFVMPRTESYTSYIYIYSKEGLLQASHTGLRFRLSADNFRELVIENMVDVLENDIKELLIPIRYQKCVSRIKFIHSPNMSTQDLNLEAIQENHNQAIECETIQEIDPNTREATKKLFQGE